MTMRTCAAPGCDRPFYCRGHCVMHYERMRKRGSLDLPLKPDRLSVLLARTQPGPDGCRLWTGYRDRAGYGRTHRGLAHREIYTLAVGPIPVGLTIDHLCMRPGCVNPEHLEAVTQRENISRGYSWAASIGLRQAKTQCPKGHPYDEMNTRITTSGARACRECGRNNKRRWDARRRDARLDVGRTIAAAERAVAGIAP